ncbi:MAG TPA: tetratricopeptide repeat protein [Gemmataceae bacterium]|nr:tetratricopeptide repeat protein [Gemmataceae bacterium]
MSETLPSPLPPRRRKLPGSALGLTLAALLTLGLAAGAWYLFHGGRSSDPAPGRRDLPEDPRLVYAGPFRNITRDVKYVGSASCAVTGCHDSKVASYSRHPMGRSLFAVAEVDPVPPEDRAHNNPFNALDSQFRVERDGDTVRHRRAAFDEGGRPVYDVSLDAAYAIGSGTHGHSYLAIREGGYVFQTPISWYAQKHTWDLSPGFREAPSKEWLTAGRPVKPDCLFCHANRAEPQGGTVNRYREPVFDGLAIGCERCHGPGEKHVAARRNKEPVEGGADYTIVHPGRLDPPLREAVCEQCHLAGEVRVLRRGRGVYDFRPGLPLEEFLTVFVRASEGGRDNKAVNHVEQMHVSRCFRDSAGDNKLGCVSCHDPHVHVVEPAERVRHYRDSCLACHQEHGCRLPREERLKTTPEDSCIDCHMPRHSLGNVPHTAATDHRIVRFRHGEGPRREPLPAGPGLPVTPFHQPPGVGLGPEAERDLAIALLGPLSETGKVAPLSYSARALRLLEPAVSRDPEDWEAQEAKANAFWAQGRRGEALAVLQTVLARAPRREAALTRAGTLARDLNQRPSAIDYWRRAVEVNPWVAGYRAFLCELLAGEGAWEELRPHCEAWLRLDPASIDARQTWVKYLLRTGRKGEARSEFERVRALRPPNLSRLQAWFDEESK